MTAKRSDCLCLKFNKKIQSTFIEGPLSTRPDVQIRRCERKHFRLASWEPGGGVGIKKAAFKGHLGGSVN